MLIITDDMTRVSEKSLALLLNGVSFKRSGGVDDRPREAER